MSIIDRIQIWIVYRVFHHGIGWLICRMLEVRARLRGKTFHCAALAGESNYNTSINANLTVSCNCQDRDGSGVIGDLKTQTFEEVWFGPKANALRESMRRGKLPITWCSNCCDRKEVQR